MKRQAYTLVALLVLVGSVAVAAQAQNSGRTELRATIPFEFHVGDKTMPAGEYRVVQINPSSSVTALQLRARDGNSVMIQMQSVTAKASDKARLVFNRYADGFYFSQAWTSADTSGWQAPKSKAERAARELAGMKGQSETIALTR